MGIIATVNKSTDNHGIENRQVLSFSTDAVAAAATSFDLGFAPRRIEFVNLTDRITDIWYEGMEEVSIQLTLRGINAKLDADAGVTPTDFAATVNPASSDRTVLRTAIIALAAKLDASAGVTDTNYAALWTPASTTSVALRAAINGITAKLDLDAGVTDVDYASLWTPAAKPSLHTVANGTATYETVNGISVVDSTFSVTAVTMVASKQYYIVCEG